MLAAIENQLKAIVKHCINLCLPIKSRLPRHVAFIMDGNRRYASKHGLHPHQGHVRGFHALEGILRECYELGVRCVTVYAFSIDNFERGEEEVGMLMELFERKLYALISDPSDDDEEEPDRRKTVQEYKVSIRVLGDLGRLPVSVRIAAVKAMKATEHHTECILNICVAYSSRHEMQIASEKLEDRQDAVDMHDINMALMTCMSPPLDLLVRTSGEIRLSDFLLWQCLHHHAQIHFIKPYWPDLTFWSMLPILLSYVFSSLLMTNRRHK